MGEYNFRNNCNVYYYYINVEARMIWNKIKNNKWIRRGGIAAIAFYTIKAILYSTLILAVYEGWLTWPTWLPSWH